MTALTTNRLTLRPAEGKDADVLHGIWTDADVRRYLWDDVVISRDRALEAIEDGIGYWVIQTNREPTAIGFCGFRCIEGTSEIELLYGLLPQYWGRGLATEAAQALLDYIWRSTAFQRVWARTDAPNEKSLGVMRRLKMRHHSSTPTMFNYVIERPSD
jgi:ribosomal-protein-alanine N-acetyltransferase